MEQRRTTRCLVLSRMLLLVLVAVMALTAVACGGQTETETEAAEPRTFTFEVVPMEGEARTFTVSTQKATVGEALMDEKLIEGEEGPYGLYVKVVDGITADYDIDRTYWSFYINGEYAMTGVDTTAVEDGATYAFRQEKG